MWIKMVWFQHIYIYWSVALSGFILFAINLIASLLTMVVFKHIWKYLWSLIKSYWPQLQQQSAICLTNKFIFARFTALRMCIILHHITSLYWAKSFGTLCCAFIIYCSQINNYTRHEVIVCIAIQTKTSCRVYIQIYLFDNVVHCKVLQVQTWLHASCIWVDVVHAAAICCIMLNSDVVIPIRPDTEKPHFSDAGHFNSGPACVGPIYLTF